MPYGSQLHIPATIPPTHTSYTYRLQNISLFNKSHTKKTKKKNKDKTNKKAGQSVQLSLYYNTGCIFISYKSLFGRVLWELDNGGLSCRCKASLRVGVSKEGGGGGGGGVIR